MPRLLILIGLPGSGKSTLAASLVQACPNRVLISTDGIRTILFGDERIQGNWLLIWQEVERQFRVAVQQMRSSQSTEAIYDATNVVRRQRCQTIALARKCGFTEITAIWLKTPIWLCLSRNQRRNRQVSPEIIYCMNRRLQGAPPSMQEDIDQLIEVGVDQTYTLKSRQIGSADLFLKELGFWESSGTDTVQTSLNLSIGLKN